MKTRLETLNCSNLNHPHGMFCEGKYNQGSDWHNYHHNESVGTDMGFEGRPEYAAGLNGKG